MFDCAQPYPKAEASTTTFSTKGATVCLVTVRRSECSKPRNIAGVLAHEAVHVYEQVLEGMGEVEPGSEFHAYGVQDIFQNLVKAYEQTRGRLFLRGQSAETI